MAAFCGRNWLPVRYRWLVNFGSTRKQRYSSVPPLGAFGVYASGIVRLTKCSPSRSGAAGGAENDPPWPACALGGSLLATATRLPPPDPDAQDATRSIAPRAAAMPANRLSRTVARSANVIAASLSGFPRRL